MPNGGILEAQGSPRTIALPEARASTPQPGRKYWLLPLTVFLIAMAVSSLAGALIYQSARRSVQSYVDLNLHAMARLKSDQLSHWLEEIEENIEVESRRIDLAGTIRRWHARPDDPTARNALLGSLAHLCAAPQAIECSVHAPGDGQLWISNGFGSDSASIRTQALAAAPEPEPQLEDLHIQHHSNPASTEIGYFYGIREMTDASETIAVLHVTVDPGGLFRVAAAGWPGLNRSFETELLGRDGQRLSEQTPPGNAPEMGQSAPPAASSASVELQAARGRSGLLSGLDERSVPVFARAFPVLGSPWFVMLRIDQSEVFSQLNTFATLAASALFAILLAPSLAWVERRRHTFNRERDRSERSMLAHRIDYLARYANDCILLSDPDGRILEVNDRCALIYGYAAPELNRMHMADLLPATAREEFQVLLARLQTHGSLICEAEHQRKDGRTFPAEVSACLINAEGKHFLQAIVRDVSERHNAEIERAGNLARERELSRRLVSIQERERRRIAADLHDGAVASLAAVKLNLNAIAKTTVDPTGVGASIVAETRELLGGTIEQIRDLCAELHPSVLEQGGVVAAIESRARQLRLRTGIDVRVHYDDFERRFSLEVESMFYRIAQEAMRNCEKHSQAKTVGIWLGRSGTHIELIVTDDGKGFDADRLERFAVGGELGLPTMRERAEFAGAEFDIDSRPGHGTRIRVRLQADKAFGADT